MERDEKVYERQGFGAGLGIKGNIGLLIVDFVNGFADPAIFGGGNIPEAIATTTRVLDEARRRKWPVAHSRIVYADNGSDATIFSTKVPGMQTLKEDAAISHIVPELTPAEGELVVRKTVPSAFFGTGLTSWLVQHRVETLLVAGATTSGCIRASVVDAMSWGFRPVVLSDCVGDRAIMPHEANLFDMGQKYADVRTFDDFMNELAKAA
ncbi:MAG: N-carbamoylsarcosine amidase [Burkholderia sp.]|nr:N-carbamoylsarcosine amidase [Burkholderia sp.]